MSGARRAVKAADSPRIKTASPHDVKKALGPHAARVLEVLDSHADCLEGLILQVEKLTVLCQPPQGFWSRLRWVVRG